MPVLLSSAVVDLCCRTGDDLAEQLDSGPNQCEPAVVRSWYAPTDPFSTGGACVGLQMTSPAGPVTFH